jgi:hypothetical protein
MTNYEPDLLPVDTLKEAKAEYESKLHSIEESGAA